MKGAHVTTVQSSRVYPPAMHPDCLSSITSAALPTVTSAPAHRTVYPPPPTPPPPLNPPFLYSYKYAKGPVSIATVSFSVAALFFSLPAPLSAAHDFNMSGGLFSAQGGQEGHTYSNETGEKGEEGKKRRRSKSSMLFCAAAR